MSRGIAQQPVVTRSGVVKIVRPAMIRSSSEAYEAVCRQFSGAQTAVPAMPETK